MAAPAAHTPHQQHQATAHARRRLSSVTGAAAAQQQRSQSRMSGDTALFMDDAGGMGGMGLGQLLRRSSHQLQVGVVRTVVLQATSLRSRT